MFLLNSLSAALVLSSYVLALPASNAEVKDAGFKSSVFERLASPPAGWVEDKSVQVDKDDSTITLRIHLVQQGMKDFHDLAMNIATPGHELYGSHLEQHVIDAMIAPKAESGDMVMEWLKASGMSSHAQISPRGDSVVVEASISKIEKLLDAEYTPFMHTESGDVVVRTLSYSLPTSFAGHVDMVQPTTFFGLKAMRSTIKKVHPITEAVSAVSAVTGCSSYVTPQCLSNLYSFSGATAYTNGLLGIAGFLEEYPSKADLTTFMGSYATEGNSGQTYTCTVVNGGSCPTNGGSSPGVEANLDVQYARAITEKIPNVYYSTGGRPPIVGSGTNTNEPYLEFLNYLLGLSTSALPNTVSISYGDDESTVPLDYADNVCNLFSQLGARGVSVLVASGDSGVGSTCKSGSTKTFTTSFPASCPWVTTVGGTTGNSPEAAWSGSGGGFSEVFGRPAYQNATVNKWLSSDTTHTANNAYFNHSGRAYPDVSAQATDFVIVVSGDAELVDGTSAATPTFASIVQLLNSDRLAKGKKVLGFLNPWLYANGTTGLTDITTGKNTGCSGVISGAGFSAVSGWDPATGLGTPIYTKLLTLARAA